MSEFKRTLLKTSGTLLGVGAFGALLQLFINWLGFGMAFPCLAVLLIALIILIVLIKHNPERHKP